VAHTTDLVTLCLLSGMEGLKIPTVNNSTAIARVHDKIKMLGLLRAAHIPCVPSYIGTAKAMSTGIPRSDFPLAVRVASAPAGGWLGVASDSSELLRMRPDNDTLISHKFDTIDGLERHLYVIGESVWAVQRTVAPDVRRMPFGSGGKLRVVPVRPAERELALHCGAVFGLELFEVQAVFTDEGHQVVDINAFPDYAGLPGVSGRLAFYVERRAREENDLSRRGT
ncbi:MAG: ATP-grasp domain-containing protein, partial [Actinomycetota bacterium]